MYEQKMSLIGNFKSDRKFIIAILIITSYFVAQTDSIFYELPPHVRDCYFVWVYYGNEIVGSYESYLGNNVLHVSVEWQLPIKKGERDTVDTPLHEVLTTANTKAQPKPIELYSSRDAEGEFHVKVTNDGIYALCIHSQISIPQTVTFSLRILPSSTSVHPHDIATLTEAERIDGFAASIIEYIQTALDQQLRAVTRERLHRSIAEQTHSRVLYCRSALLLIIIALCIFQLYYIRSFF